MKYFFSFHTLFWENAKHLGVYVQVRILGPGWSQSNTIHQSLSVIRIYHNGLEESNVSLKEKFNYWFRHINNFKVLSNVWNKECSRLSSYPKLFHHKNLITTKRIMELFRIFFKVPFLSPLWKNKLLFQEKKKKKL